MNFKTLTLVEKKKLERSLRIVSKLAQRKELSETNEFILRQRMRYILVLLGARHINVVLVVKGIDIMRDCWPFKLRRLRKLVNERLAKTERNRRL